MESSIESTFSFLPFLSFLFWFFGVVPIRSGSLNCVAQGENETGGGTREGEKQQKTKKFKKKEDHDVEKQEKREATWGLSKALRAVAIPETYSGLWFTVTTQQLVKVHHNWDGFPAPFFHPYVRI